MEQRSVETARHEAFEAEALCHLRALSCHLVRADALRRAARRLVTVCLSSEPASRAGEAAFASEDLRLALLGLPEAYRTAVLLRDVDGFSYGEIAGLLQVPIGNIGSARTWNGASATRRRSSRPRRRHTRSPFPSS